MDPWEGRRPSPLSRSVCPLESFPTRPARILNRQVSPPPGVGSMARQPGALARFRAQSNEEGGGGISKRGRRQGRPPDHAQTPCRARCGALGPASGKGGPPAAATGMNGQRYRSYLFISRVLRSDLFTALEREVLTDAAEGLLLDLIKPRWRERYFVEKFDMQGLFRE